MFALECRGSAEVVRAHSLPPFLKASRVELSTARAALGVLHEFLAPTNVWLPSYLCGAIVDALSARNARLCFFPVDERLRLTDDRWLETVLPGDMVVFIDYFGFAGWESYGAEARRRGAWVIEDACQALLNRTFSTQAHYTVFSPRKFVGVPDGGILTSFTGAQLPEIDAGPPPLDWWLDALSATQLRGVFDRCGGDREWFTLFRRAEAAAPVHPARMSELSAALLLEAVDYDERIAKRRANYACLASLLPDDALFPSLGPDEVPLGFPVVFRDRGKALTSLYAEQIYPAVHWPIDDVVPREFEASHRLSRKIATLPCDHRCGEHDMERMAALVRGHLPSA